LGLIAAEVAGIEALRSTYCVEVNDLHDEVSSTSDNDGEARRVPGPLKERHRFAGNLT